MGCGEGEDEWKKKRRFFNLEEKSSKFLDRLSNLINFTTRRERRRENAKREGERKGEKKEGRKEREREKKKERKKERERQFRSR